ncbi:hypothetical protein T492DRAFT_886207, partial [Pavlovales sp. CCMP2436]
KPVAELKQWLKEKGHAVKGLLKADLIARTPMGALVGYSRALSPLDMTLELATCFLDLPRSLGFAGERPTAACFPIVTHTLESATRLFDLLRALGDKEELSLA